MSPEPFRIDTLVAGYRERRFTPVDIAEAVLARVDACEDPAVWIHRIPTEAVRARAAELADGPKDLPLYGIPFAIKDNIDVAGLPTTAACPAFAYDAAATATVVRRLLDAGAILVGKTNMDQFATGLVGTRSPYGAPRSVFDARYISGGSSSGSAVAVARGLVAFALGTDTAGSGRVPAAFNDIVGLKPTRGLVSTAGVVPACRSLDCVSLFAHTAAEALHVLETAQGFDAADPYSRIGEPIALPREGLRVGVLAPADREFFGDDAAADLYDLAVARLDGLGARAVEVEFRPFREAAALLYGGPWVAERMAAIEPFFRAHAEEMDPTVRRIIGGADRYAAVDAYRGEYRLRELARAAAEEWRRFDVMLLPTAPTIYTVDEVAADPVGANARLGSYTNFVNLLDYAAIAVPAGFRPDGLPFGVTLIGPAFSDLDLAGLADWFHRGIIPAAPTTGIEIAVAGAHLSGLPLNHELTGLGGVLARTARTAACYRLLALAGTVPPKPGLVATPGYEGPGIEVEIWRLSEQAFGRFVAGVAAPMAIGKVQLADGSLVPGFVCEPRAVAGAEDITRFGGWRAYLARDGG